MPTNDERCEISKEGTTIKEMVSEWLKVNGYQGLYNKNSGCSCGIDYLMICIDCVSRNCSAAYEFRCYECVRFDDCEKRDGYDYVYSCDKNWCDYEKAE